ncbi:hypothetical protein [Promicromonospora sp. NPDC057488]|uniref:hypothetical protein n=1 Tax=Promicromonospora sp. NPDC057488 TaxID=3346147 RepID=UPI00366FF74F
MTAALLAVATASAANASQPPTGDQHAGAGLSFVEYMRANPGDWEGAAALVESYGGSINISDGTGRSVTPDEAADLSNRLPSGVAGPLDWPANAFTTLVSVVDLGSFDPNTVQIYGEWNWRDDFIGQGSPEDIASLQLNKNCGTYSNYFGSAATWNGFFTTDRLSLRSGGTGTAGPVWNVYDQVSNFENLTDRGMLGVDYDISSCPANVKESLQAETLFEGNDGGTVVSVSIAWGLINIGYNSPGFSQTRSSGAASVGEVSGTGW